MTFPEQKLLKFKIYTLCGCRNLGDYYDVYLRTDFLILADFLGNSGKLVKKFIT